MSTRILDQAGGRQNGAVLIPALIAAAAALALIVQRFGIPNHDVAFLTWAAGKVLGGSVFGRDFYEPNPPLSMLIYMPAAVLAKFMGFEVAIRLWTISLFAFSVAVLWQTAEPRSRAHVAVALALFFALAFPREFAQREQIALLLTAPYAAGHARSRSLGVLSGVMAGVGFAIKPYFLVPFALLFLARRKVRAEEWAIAATGAAYAALILLVFRPYLFDMVPAAAATYWAVAPNPGWVGWVEPAMVVMIGGALSWVSAPQPGTGGYLLAALGFALAALLQGKAFPYHYVPAWGFLTLYVASHLVNARPFARTTALLLLLAECYRLSAYALPWLHDVEGRRIMTPALLQEIGPAESFAVLSVYPYPAFPLALMTDARFTGVANGEIFMPAVAKLETGEASGDKAEASRLALTQALRELAAKPDLVIVDTDWQRHTGLKRPFDGLAWLRRDPGFQALWKDYALSGKVGDYELYRRRAASH